METIREEQAASRETRLVRVLPARPQQRPTRPGPFPGRLQVIPVFEPLSADKDAFLEKAAPPLESKEESFSLPLSSEKTDQEGSPSAAACRAAEWLGL